MTEDEWQELRRRYLAANMIYIPDTPEHRAMYEGSVGPSDGLSGAEGSSVADSLPESEVAQAEVPAPQEPSSSAKQQDEINLLNLMTGGNK